MYVTGFRDCYALIVLLSVERRIIAIYLGRR